MYLSRLALTDFRSYAATDLALAPGISTFLGANGEGKTNLVEAVWYVATLGSHRVAADAPLVRHGADRAVLRAAVVSGGSDSLVEIEINPGRSNRARLNRAPVARPRRVLGVLRAVLFAPEDLALVKGDPEQRRRFLDDLLVTRAPRYAAVRSDYERVLRQRTALLKSLRGGMGARLLAGARRGGRDSAGGGARHGAGGAARDGDGVRDGAGGGARDGAGGGARDGGGPAPRMLDVWDDQLATLGAELLAGRIGLTSSLRPLVARAYRAVSGGGDEAVIGYRQSLPRGAVTHPNAVPGGPARRAEREGGVPGAVEPGAVEPGAGEPPADHAVLADSLREALARVRADELERGVCLVGPHRDDLELRIGELPARGYASQGESWSAALALRLASYELLRAAGDDPVLMLDDVFAELDDGRRQRLAGLVAAAEQVLVTAAVPGDVPAVLAGARFEVANGTVARAG